VTTVTRLHPQACPVCSKTLDAAGPCDGSDEIPQPGSWTVCSGCLAWLHFDAEMQLQIVSDKDWMALPEDERHALQGHQQRVRQAWRLPPDH
jgi:hypothetical protein